MHIESFLIKNSDSIPIRRNSNNPLRTLKNINKIHLIRKLTKYHKDPVFLKKLKNFVVAKKEINKKNFD